MLFNSFVFWIFFAAVLALYGVLAHRWQNRMLLAASLVFYGWWDFKLGTRGCFLGLMLATALVDACVGQRIAAAAEARVRKRWLYVSLISNLGVLGFFKYCNFFTETIQAGLRAAGWDVPQWKLDIILPVGISFYTFQSLSYTIDIYRGQLRPARSMLDFLLFVTLFPQLVAGPIERASHLLPQVERPRRMTWDGWREGFTLCLLGLFKKVVVADTLAPTVDGIFRQPETCSAGTLLFGVYAFSLQIYADFSGYSDIARGLAKILGFDLMENFNQPYFAANVTDFWRRWHISLSTWLRDYLYIPLGGNRLGAVRTYVNLFVTMFLGGLWHGANWTFVVWGSLHGVYLAAHRLWLRAKKPALGPPPAKSQWPLHLVKVAATFHLVALAWIFFRARSFTDAFHYLGGLFSLRSYDAMKETWGQTAFRLDTDQVFGALWLALALAVVVDIPQYVRRDHLAVLRWSRPARVAAFSVLAVWLLTTRGGENVPFVYFQF